MLSVNVLSLTVATATLSVNMLTLTVATAMLSVKRACHKPSSFVNGMMECAKSQIFLKLLQQIYFMESSTDP